MDIKIWINEAYQIVIGIPDCGALVMSAEQAHRFTDALRIAASKAIEVRNAGMETTVN